MLIKLMKYDMKTLSRTLLLLHAFVAIFALIGRIFIMSNVGVQEPNALEITYIIVFLLLLVIISAATYIIIAVHFYRGLFSTQGYLSWTLPVTANQHLLSKLFVALLWSILSLFLLSLAFCIFFLNTDIITLVDDFFQYFGDSSVSLILATMIFFLLSALASILTLFASATIGQLFANHRVIASLVTYGIFSLILQFVYTISFVVMSHNDLIIEMEASELALEASSEIGISIYHNLLFTANLILIVSIIIFYAITYYITKRKLNLA